MTGRFYDDETWARMTADTGAIAEDPILQTAPPRAITRGKILREAERLVCEEREAQYCDPHEMFEMVAQIWSIRVGKPMSAAFVCSLMADLKQVRAQLGAPNPDNYTDACGYLALAGELSQRGDR